MFGFQFKTLTLIMILLPGLANAEIYRWTDETGKIHYSDKKPPGITAEKKTYVNVATPWRKVPKPERTMSEGVTVDDTAKQQEAQQNAQSPSEEELSSDKSDKKGSKKTKRLKAKQTSDNASSDTEDGDKSEPVRLNQKDKSSYTPAKRAANIKESYKQAKKEYLKAN